MTFQQHKYMTIISSLSHCIPKLSASVKYSLARPDHCFEIFPTGCVPSALSTYMSLAIIRPPPSFLFIYVLPETQHLHKTDKYNMGPSSTTQNRHSHFWWWTREPTMYNYKWICHVHLLYNKLNESLLFHITNDGSRRWLHFHFLETAETTETGAAHRSLQMYHLCTTVVSDGHGKRPAGSAVLSQTAIGLCK